MNDKIFKQAIERFKEQFSYADKDEKGRLYQFYLIVIDLWLEQEPFKKIYEEVEERRLK